MTLKRTQAWRVKRTRVWEWDISADSREEARDIVLDFAADGLDAEGYSVTTVRPLPNPPIPPKEEAE